VPTGLAKSLEEYISFLTSKTVEKLEVFMTKKKITCQHPRKQHARAYFPVHQIFRPEECKTCSLDGKVHENTSISVTIRSQLQQDI